MSTTFQEVKAKLKDISAKVQEDFDQKKLNIQLVLNLDSDRVYINTNLDDQKVLEHTLS